MDSPLIIPFNSLDRTGIWYAALHWQGQTGSEWLVTGTRVTAVSGAGAAGGEVLCPRSGEFARG